MKHSFISTLLVCGTLSSVMVTATESVPMQVTKAAVFKNGYSQVSLSGKINSGDTQLEVTGMPVPILGSFWWKAPQGSSVREVRSETVTRNVLKQNCSTLDFLLANAGQQAEIVLTNGAKIEGIIHAPANTALSGSFLQYNHNAESQDEQEYDNMNAATEALLQQRNRAEIAAVQLRTAGGFVTLREQNILYAEVKNTTPQLPTVSQKVNTLVFELDAPAPGKELQVSGLCRGLSWLPSYRMDLRSDGKALFQCKAVVMNELADLNNVQLELVMGYPALGKYLLPSPVAHYHSLFGFLKELSSVDSQNSRREVSLINNCSWYQPEEKSDASDLTQAEDLFFYSIPDFTCASGQTVTREIFSGEVSYSHVYTWNIPTQSDIQRWQESRRSHYGSQVPPPNEVWHCVKVRNSLKTPWTGGVLDCYAEDRLVGRTEITFTADGGSTLVRLNKTMQAPVQFSETILNENGDVSTMEGKLSLANYSDKEMLVIITKEVDGTPLSASDGATSTCSPNDYKNPDGRFVWEVCVQPGETKTVTYQYNHKD